ncbi:MAG: hypothetical protein COT39_00625 [Parcubacteria group bacterium CG08_land_8_20_14_0_20_48_21]|nr:MAG: hypothetical protein AUK21_03740 [Parcubacteria group bacterium CG2_30_48_51]PIS33166.1 MAG: hypothetical protein COT39_00625 [Parcubacteria group bacterium CG08_land_8_20_14_0_20_48_21]PIW79409.1 MAG: hypothetical protein COZ99_01150 [Parcubacteria group bacterium CG_4_8_14_3_um_filter_48_16]PIY77669.1 MAG: hypothetical protein COY83_03975 [Parcubacteria group bacterium CG_4_10_14_0_8_um_filter_48_154]PIZ77445.1 MAG: hypothetical protein COY03_02835 [bacterium CG_4_10_14_0_2_um_filter_
MHAHKGNNLLNAKEILAEVGVRKDMHVADLGCGGSGHFVIPAAKMVGEHGVVYAVDILQKALESVQGKARGERLGQLHTIWADIESFGATPIAEKSLDQAYLINVLFQSINYAAIIGEAYLLLQKGGLLLVIDWDSTPSPFGPTSDQQVRQQDVEDRAMATGFVLRKRFKPGKYHFGLIFIKK